MPSTSVTISDYEIWGNLVKSWATGENRFGGADPIPIPHDLDDLLAQCADVGVALTLEPEVKGVAFVRYSEEILTIKLPPKSMVKETEQKLDTGPDDYPLPPFYDLTYATFAGATDTPLKMPTPQQRRKFHAERIGDYSVQNCG